MSKINNSNLIFDLGLHIGEDTAYYLNKGYKVIAVDANVEMIEQAKNNFLHAVEKEQLILENCAISLEEDKHISFYISKHSEWSSLNKGIANREGQFKYKINVPTIKLSSLFKKHGIPYYCKIDIEGYDLIALESLKELNAQPKYISVESECAIDDKELTEDEAMLSLNLLHQLGYKKFKLVDQHTLSTLPLNKKFYYPLSKSQRKWYRLLYYLGITTHSSVYILKLRKKVNYQFKVGSSGAFGEDLDGEWIDYYTARQHLIFHRRQYFNLQNSNNYGFWCDWHATY